MFPLQYKSNEDIFFVKKTSLLSFRKLEVNFLYTLLLKNALSYSGTQRPVTGGMVAFECCLWKISYQVLGESRWYPPGWRWPLRNRRQAGSPGPRRARSSCRRKPFPGRGAWRRWSIRCCRTRRTSPPDLLKRCCRWTGCSWVGRPCPQLTLSPQTSPRKRLPERWRSTRPAGTPEDRCRLWPKQGSILESYFISGLVTNSITRIMINKGIRPIWVLKI